MRYILIYTVCLSFFIHLNTGFADNSQKQVLKSLQNNMLRLSRLSQKRKQKNKKLRIMVSSTVYGIEPMLDEVYMVLTGLGYEVWMSHKGTLPVCSKKTAFENCLQGVRDCDLFFCIITPQYGSGVDSSGISITHKELLEAIRLGKPRWIVAHDHVVFSRTLMRNLGYFTKESRESLTLRQNPVLGSLKVIDMYEAAILHGHPLSERRGNWVQKYVSFADVVRYVQAQFQNRQLIFDRLSSE
jgi:hypothetical protein